MKTKFSKLALIAAIGLAAAGTSYAHEDYSEAGTYHWLSHVSESKSAPTANQQASFGYAATKNADREITLASGSKYLNVTRLETVKINI
ncbi:MAG: CzcE family metal-binding protein, partial [Opitutaceae bacterium]|nr:CzcE family metal-binding protein [Opitutaceae bacterium]